MVSELNFVVLNVFYKLSMEDMWRRIVYFNKELE